METIMYILAGILTGGLIAYLFFNNKLRKLAQEIALLTQKTLQLNENRRSHNNASTASTARKTRCNNTTYYCK